MWGAAIHIKLKINFLVIFFLVLMAHILIMVFNGIMPFHLSAPPPKEQTPPVIKIRRVKTAEVNHPQIDSQQGIFNQKPPISAGRDKNSVSLKDLSLQSLNADSKSLRPLRPGQKPIIKKSHLPRSTRAIGLRSQELKDFSNSYSTGKLALSDRIVGSERINDAVVSIEVPDGVEPDELNKYELMFYSFQKRIAINYVNSILRNLSKFQKKYPNYKLPTSGSILMTARVTYDSLGNMMQIKMIRWTNINEVQNLFEDVVKDIDQLHNPPKSLWEKNDQFSLYYTLEIVNG